jgi:BirA family biotin operon repressor/biotin-[acetyl-CoA-carboxylase] ligase
MSIIVTPKQQISQQFVFSASVAVAIANVLQNFLPANQVFIKWPNDIIINDKKAAGILIENVLRGNHWTYSIIGLGLNVNQDMFPASLPNATSLRIESGRYFDLAELRDRLAEQVQSAVSNPMATQQTMDSYNDLLYKRGRKQKLSDDSSFDWTVTVLGALPDGRLEVKLQDGTIRHYQHGEVIWEW